MERLHMAHLIKMKAQRAFPLRTIPANVTNPTALVAAQTPGMANSIVQFPIHVVMTPTLLAPQTLIRSLGSLTETLHYMRLI